MTWCYMCRGFGGACTHIFANDTVKVDASKMEHVCMAIGKDHKFGDYARYFAKRMKERFADRTCVAFKAADGGSGVRTRHITVDGVRMRVLNFPHIEARQFDVLGWQPEAEL